LNQQTCTPLRVQELNRRLFFALQITTVTTSSSWVKPNAQEGKGGSGRGNTQEEARLRGGLSVMRIDPGAALRRLLPPRINDYFSDTVFLIAPNLVHLRHFVERDAVGNDVAWINLSFFDTLQ
jgi:hypothetical protein